MDACLAYFAAYPRTVANVCNAVECVGALEADDCGYGRVKWVPPVCYTVDDSVRYEPPPKAWLEGWSYE